MAQKLLTDSDSQRGYSDETNRLGHLPRRPSPAGVKGGPGAAFTDQSLIGGSLSRGLGRKAISSVTATGKSRLTERNVSPVSLRVFSKTAPLLRI